ncbi:MAG: hypothetical protein Q4B35_06415 [Slackia sp.]|nr:hypothetical protein [Slackia sp.]
MPDSNLEYVSGVRGVSVDLDCRSTLAGTALEVRGSGWDYAASRTGSMNAARSWGEVEFDVSFFDPAAADLFAELTSEDVAQSRPGSLVSNGWRKRCYIVGCRLAKVTPAYHTSEVTALLLDGVWRRSRRVSFMPSAGAGTSGPLDLPHDLPNDLAPLPAPSKVEMRGAGGGPVGITVYGPATSPYIAIGGNTYKVDCSVPAGGYLTVDPVSEPKRVYLTDETGAVTDEYANAELGDGEGSGSYVFERLPRGFHSVSWTGSFGFDLELYEEVGELPWTS